MFKVLRCNSITRGGEAYDQEMYLNDSRGDINVGWLQYNR